MANLTCDQDNMAEHFGWHTCVHEHPTTSILKSMLCSFWRFFSRLQRPHGNGMCSLTTFRTTHKTGIHSIVSLQKLWENRVYFCMVFRRCRRAFSKIASRIKASCNLEQLYIGQRGLSTEWEPHLKISSAGEILGSAGHNAKQPAWVTADVAGLKPLSQG